MAILMPGDPYCGNCHQWMTPMFDDTGQGATIWSCFCTFNGRVPDKSKDPHCKNPGHRHHDPQSPIVLSCKAIDEAEEEAESSTPFLDTVAELDEILEETNRQVETCGGCHLKELVLDEAKRLMRNLLREGLSTNASREAERFLRMSERRVRAMETLPSECPKCGGKLVNPVDYFGLAKVMED